MSQTPQEMVRGFHTSNSQPIGEVLTDLTASRRELRVALIREEFEELEYASNRADIVEIADALGDIVYLCYGMAIEMGFDLDVVLAEIHRGNMSKLGADGLPIINGITVGYRDLGGYMSHEDGSASANHEDGFRTDQPIGKVLKGPNYLPPDILSVLLKKEF